MNENNVLEMLKQVKAIITDSHIVYTSGRHGDTYINKDAIYPYTNYVARLCDELANRFVSEMPEVIIAPATGGIILSQWTAHFLSAKYTTQVVLGVYAEKDHSGKSFVIKRGYDKLVTGKRVLVVEDILTTGGSAKGVIEAVRAINGNVVGVGALCNRGGITTADLAHVPKLISLMNIKLDSWNEEECPLCKAKISINTDVGKGREFLARLSNPPCPNCGHTTVRNGAIHKCPNCGASIRCS